MAENANVECSREHLGQMPSSSSCTGRRALETEYCYQMRQSCKTAVDKAVDYLLDIEKHQPFAQVEPGFLLPLLPKDPPRDSVPMDDIFEDVDRLLLPGVTHWNHPHFHAYFPAGNSYPAVCAEIIASGIGGVGFTWASSPISTELEVVMTDWLAKMLGLPDYFQHGIHRGGGVIGTTCSEQLLVTLMVARNLAIEKYMTANPGATKYEAMSKLVCYASSLSHCSVEKAALLSVLNLRLLPTNDKYELTGEVLRAALKEDLANGKIPFHVVATLGTTSCCSFDRLDEIGPVCEEFNVWLHVDAAYAGSSFICPEFRHYIKGVEYASSFVFNPHKWLLTNFDCSCVWFRDTKNVTNNFNTEADYLKHSKLGKMPDYRHIRMAKYFESLIRKDPRFEVIGEVTMGLVCFRVKGNNELTMKLFERIEQDGRIHIITSTVISSEGETIAFIRVAIVYQFTDEEICQYAYSVISESATEVLPKKNGFRIANGNI